MINGRPVSEVAAEQNATHNSAMATAEENAKKAKEKADAKAAADAAEKEKKKKQVGSYTIYFESGKKYHGKGPKSRMALSAAYRAKVNSDTVIGADWTPAVNDKEAFIDEYVRLAQD